MRFARFLALLFGIVFAFAQPVRAQQEPSVDQIYQAASRGDLPQAQRMIDEVLARHPNSAKAHYVKAELSARAIDAPRAREELAAAERLAPGLPFAKPEAVQALRTQIDRLARAPADSTRPITRQMGAPGGDAAIGGSGSPAAASTAARGGVPWGLLVVGGAVVVGVMLMMRRRRGAPADGGMGSGAPGMPGAPGTGPYGPAGSGTPPGGAYPGQPYGAQPGMGSTLGRGLATGLAIGAGAVAAQEIGRRVFDHNDSHGQRLGTDPGYPPADVTQLDGIANADMGGQDFGLNDAGSWDDGGGSFDAGGGGDWDT